MPETTGTRYSAAFDRRRSTRSPSHVDPIVGILQAIHGFVLFLILLAILLLLALGGLSHYTVAQWTCFALFLEAVVLTYFGLQLRKPWAVPIVVFWSVYVVIASLSGQPASLVEVAITRTFSALALFQLWFFTRPTTRSAFEADGTLVF